MSRLRSGFWCVALGFQAVTVFGQGDGTFLAEVSFPLNDLAAAFRPADLNGDRVPDLAVAGSGGDIFVFLNRDGVLEPQEPRFPGGVSPLHLAAADLDGDGALDLLSTDSGSDSVAVLLGVGDGTFGAAKAHAAGSGARQSEVADFDRDGKADIAVLNNIAGNLSLLRGIGAGDFAPAETLQVGRSPHALVVEDFNVDGWPDMAVAIGDEAKLKVLFGGEGGFTAATFAVGQVPRALAAGDFDGDGNPDVAVANQSSENITVLMGDGAGALESGPAVPLGTAPDQLYAADFDGDGRLDLAVVVLELVSFDGELRVLLADGNGGYDPSPFTFTLPGMMVVGVEDFDLDGVTDLALGSNSTAEMNLLSGRGDGTFLARTTLETGRRPRSVAAADLNADGRLDLVSANSQEGTLSFFAGGGDGTFADREDLEGQGSSFHSVVTADFDSSAGTDLAAADFAGGGAKVYLAAAGAAPQFSASYATGLLPVQVLAGDFIGSDAQDLAILHQGEANIAILEGLGNGSFAAASKATVLSAPSRFTAGDIDGDRNADFVVAGKKSLAVYFGDGAGSLPRTTAIPSASESVALTIHDLNVDGQQDIVVAESEGEVKLYFGAGGGALSEAVVMPVGNGPSAVAAADLNGDGLPDLLVGQAGSDSVRVFEGQGDRSFQPLASYRLGDPRWIVTADLDADGALDVVSADFSTDTLSLLFGRRAATAERFRRGDADVDARVNLTDAVVTLEHLFQGGGPLACGDAADVDDDGRVNLTDVILLLGYLFQAGAPPAVPGPESCGEDPGGDDLGDCVFDRC
ncbi:MAG: VCBS repeat-containing protein [Planctomycetes bacterium]|nr:VCBS repeat-containing protein [Planctomycetota bacterium]